MRLYYDDDTPDNKTVFGLYLVIGLLVVILIALTVGASAAEAGVVGEAISVPFHIVGGLFQFLF